MIARRGGVSRRLGGEVSWGGISLEIRAIKPHSGKLHGKVSQTLDSSKKELEMSECLA